MTFEQILSTAERFAKMNDPRGSYAAVYSALKEMETLEDPEGPVPYYVYFVRCLNVIKDANDKFDKTEDESDREIYRWAITGATEDAEEEVLKLIDNEKFKTGIITRVIYDLAEHANDKPFQPQTGSLAQ